MSVTHENMSVDEFQLIAQAAKIDGQVPAQDRSLLIGAAKKAGLSDVERQILDKSIDDDRLQPQGFIGEKDRQRLFKSLIHLLTEGASAETVGVELRLIGRVGVALGLSRERIKTMVDAAIKRHQTARTLVQLDRQLTDLGAPVVKAPAPAKTPGITQRNQALAVPQAKAHPLAWLGVLAAAATVVLVVLSLLR